MSGRIFLNFFEEQIFQAPVYCLRRQFPEANQGIRGSILHFILFTYSFFQFDDLFPSKRIFARMMLENSAKIQPKLAQIIFQVLFFIKKIYFLRINFSEIRSTGLEHERGAELRLPNVAIWPSPGFAILLFSGEGRHRQSSASR